MQLKSVISALALATALGFAAPAYAQVTIGGTAVPEDEVDLVRDQCLELQTAEGAEPIGVQSDDSSAQDSEGSDESGASLPSESSTVSGTEQDQTSIDLGALTLEQCEESGLLDGDGASGGADGATNSSNTTTTGGTTSTGNNTTATGNDADGSQSGSEDTQGGEVTEGDAANTGDEEGTGESDAPGVQ